MTQKEVAKTDTAAPVVFNQEELGSWGSNPMTSNDLVIPKLLVMQGMSKVVVAGKAKLGDIVDSVTEEVVGNVNQPVDIIPFFFEKIWIVQKWNGKKFEYNSIEKMDSTNENLPWEYETPEGKFKRIYTRNVYAMIKDKPLPYIISFSSTSARAGKELVTLMYSSNAIQKLPPCGHHVDLGCKLESNDDGTYAVKTIKVGQRSSKEEVEKAYQWFTILNNKEISTTPHDADELPF